MCSKSADGSGQAKSPSEATSILVVCFDVCSEAKEDSWLGTCLAGALSRMEYHSHARSSFHGHPIPSVGRHEEVGSTAAAGRTHCRCDGYTERGLWIDIWSHCGWINNST